MFHLEATNRCHLFELIARYVWDSIVHNHKYKLHKSEIGITNDIIALIRDHKLRNQNFGVWANLAIKESIYGCDIDVFVETGIDEFIWYALQAKVLKLNGRYERLRDKSQWIKLSNLKDISGCIPFYLFYNGFDKVPGTFKDCCLQTVKETQLGCALVSIKDVERITSEKPIIRYADFFPAYIHPWRELVCCVAKRRGGARYSLQEVRNAVSLYTGLLNTDIMEQGNNNEQLSQNEITISAANQNVGRAPSHSFVIRTTASLMQ